MTRCWPLIFDRYHIFGMINVLVPKELNFNFKNLSLTKSQKVYPFNHHYYFLSYETNDGSALTHPPPPLVFIGLKPNSSYNFCQNFFERKNTAICITSAVAYRFWVNELWNFLKRAQPEISISSLFVWYNESLYSIV